MNILKKHSKIEDVKEVTFIGLFAPKEVTSFLTLYSNATGITKSKILYKVIKTWYDAQIKDDPIDELIAVIAKRALEGFHNLRRKSITFYAFCSMMRNELAKKGVEPETIDRIIERLKNEKKKED